MKSPYYIDEPAAISFSGGRTSAYMLWRVLQAHGGVLPDYVKVTFANTGREMPETLDFVRDCGEQWGVDIAWVEYDGRTIQENGKNFDYRYRVVDHDSASRNGEPFSLLVKDTGRLPNPVSRYCSGQLKVRTIKRYLIDQGFELPYTALIGIRGDEKHRAVKLHGKLSDGQDCWCPLYVDGITKEDIYEFCDRHGGAVDTDRGTVFHLGSAGVDGLELDEPTADQAGRDDGRSRVGGDGLVVLDGQLDLDPGLEGRDLTDRAHGHAQHSHVITDVKSLSAAEGDVNRRVTTANQKDSGRYQQAKDEGNSEAAHQASFEQSGHGRIPDKIGARVAGSVRFWM